MNNILSKVYGWGRVCALQVGRKSGGALLFVSIATSPIANAGSINWAHLSGTMTSNGSVTIKTLSGGAYAATQNPSGAIAKTNQNAATQPPTVLIQATASLPIKAVGDACTSTTSGTSPNQSADEGTAITSDRTLLLTCQSGSWTKQGQGSTAITPNPADAVGKATAFCDLGATSQYFYDPPNGPQNGSYGQYRVTFSAGQYYLEQRQYVDFAGGWMGWGNVCQEGKLLGYGGPAKCTQSNGYFYYLKPEGVVLNALGKQLVCPWQ